MSLKRLCLAFVMAVMLTSTGLADAQDDPTAACQDVGGTYDTREDRCTLASAVELSIDYPLEALAYPDIDAFLRAYLFSYRDQFVEDFAMYGLNDPFSSVPWALDIRYDLYTHSDSVWSFHFTEYTYTGGAHGNTAFAAFTFYLETQQIIPFDALWQADADPLARIAPEVRAQVTAVLGADFVDSDWLKDGSGTNPNNYQIFVLTEDALIFFFPPYQLAPYAAGPLQTVIPLTDVSDILSEPFVPNE